MREILKVKRKITPADAKNRLKSTFPDLIVKEMYDYDKDWYMAMATDSNETDYGSPYYLIGKTNERVCSFSPVANLDKFTKALDNEVEF